MSKRLFAQLAAVMALNLGAPCFAFADRNPVGEQANYVVDRNSSRTSSMVQSGTMATGVTQHLPNDPEGPSYEVKLDYSFKIRIIGNRSGSQVLPVPESYFTTEFMAELRKNGIYESPKFKVKHLGYGNVRTMDGRIYENCDKVLIYDVQMGTMVGEVAAALLAPAEAGLMADEIEDLEITAFVKEGMPVLGAVKLDVTGKYNGMNIKAGADYKAQ